MNHPSVFFCVLTTVVVFGDRSKLSHPSHQLLVPLSYFIVPAWSQPILVKQVYSLAESHHNDGPDKKQDQQDGAVFRSDMTAQNHVRAIVLSETSGQDLSTNPNAAATLTATEQPSPILAPTAPAYERASDGDADCPDMLTDDEGAAIVTRALRPLAISAMSLNIFIICVLVAATIVMYKKRGRKLCFGPIEADDTEYTLNTMKRSNCKMLPRLQIDTISDNPFDRSYPARPESMMSCIKEERSFATSSTPSPSLLHFPPSPTRPPPRLQSMATHDPDASFLSLESQPKHKISLQSMRTLSLKPSRASMTT